MTLQIPSANQLSAMQQQSQKADDIAITVDETAPLLNKDPVITIDTVSEHSTITYIIIHVVF